MAEIDNTMSGIMWQWLAEHKQDVLDYFGSIMREASDIQLVNFDSQRHMGLLATFVYQGVRRVDNVKPQSVVEGLTRLNEELRIRCENAASEAERQGTYAKTQGDRVDQGILDLTNLKNTVQQQGNTAEQQGANAQSICDNVTNWYTPFKTNAENWLSDTKAGWNQWYPQTQDEWDEWYQARLQQWASWYTNGIVPTWNDFWDGVQQDWQNWSAAESLRQARELDRIANELLRVADEEVRQQNEQERQRKEAERIAAENQRQIDEAERQVAESQRQRTFETNEANRQQTFDGNEAQRQQDFEDAENERMESMLITRAYIDYSNFHLKFLTPEANTADYKVRNGHLKITVLYDDGTPDPEENEGN